MKFTLLDQLGNPIAMGSAELNPYKMWVGTIESHTLPEELMGLFLEMQEYINNQVFHAYDRVQEQANNLHFQIQLEGGRTIPAYNLMINEDLDIAWKENRKDDMGPGGSDRADG